MSKGLLYTHLLDSDTPQRTACGNPVEPRTKVSGIPASVDCPYCKNSAAFAGYRRDWPERMSAWGVKP